MKSMQTLRSMNQPGESENRKILFFMRFYYVCVCFSCTAFQVCHFIFSGCSPAHSKCWRNHSAQCSIQALAWMPSHPRLFSLLGSVGSEIKWAPYVGLRISSGCIRMWLEPHTHTRLKRCRAGKCSTVDVLFPKHSLFFFYFILNKNTVHAKKWCSPIGRWCSQRRSFGRASRHYILLVVRQPGSKSMRSLLIIIKIKKKITG